MNIRKEKILAIMTCVAMWAAVFTAAAPVTAGAAMITVPDDYPTIQQAVDAANAGDIVYVRSGTYYEHVTIGKSLTLQGESRDTTIIDGDGSDNVVYLGTSNVMVTRFTVRNGNRGVCSYSASYSKIIDCIVTHNYQYGISLEYSSYSEVRNCDVSDTYGPGDYGVALGVAIYMWGASNSIIEDTRIFDNENTCRVFIPYHSDDTLIKNVEMFNNKGGICAGFANYTMENINIHDNDSGFGIEFNGASNGSLRNSVIRSIPGNGVSLIFHSCNNVIEGNIIRSNNTGIRIGGAGVLNNHFYHNDMVNNVHQVTDQAPGDPGAEAQYWDDGYPSGGNYWSDYTGADLYSGPNQDVPGSDGIGDTPYLMEVNAKDNYPLMQPYNMAAPMGTAFTYQGRLIDNNQPADGLYDFRFKLFDNESNGNQFGTDVSRSEVNVIDGYFMVELDFGSVFNGDERWLEIGVRPGEQNDPNVYTTLSPRQELTPTPYALYAETAGCCDSLWKVSMSQLGPTNNIYYNDGNVGIGTTNPGQKLSVAGMIESTSGGFKFPDGSIQTTAVSGGGIPSGVIVMWSGSIASIPAGWHLCDGTNGTPNLRSRFIVGAGSGYDVGNTGGADSVTLTISQMPSHRHQIYGDGNKGLGGYGVFPTTQEEWHEYTLSTYPTGGDQPHENRPPYYALAYIMKL